MRPSPAAPPARPGPPGFFSQTADLLRGSFLLLVWFVVLCSPFHAFPASPARVNPTECTPTATDFSFLTWSDGWLDGQPRPPAHLWIHTGGYAAVFDPWTADLLRFGRPLASPPPPAATGRQPDRRPWVSGVPALPSPADPAAAILDATRWMALEPRVLAEQTGRLPPAGLELVVQHAGTTYRCRRGAGGRSDWMNFPVRLVEGGRFVQRFDVLQLEFEDDAGKRLEADARLEVVAWPDALRFCLEVGTARDLGLLTLALRARTAAPAGVLRSVRQASREEGNRVVWSAELLLPSPEPGAEAPRNPARSRSESGPEVSVGAVDRRDGRACPVTEDPVRGWHRVVLPSRRGSIADDPDRLERIQIALTNASPREQVVRLLFDDPTGTVSITGVTPMLRRLDGTPTGIPVQISKNWHRQPDRRLLHEGPWLHAFTLLRLPAESRTEVEFTLAFARWGGVPAASHAQLSLIGWGWNQRWDQVAIGSWGETICYEPDAIQQRCRIDDLRPLMVWGMGEGQKRWTWTHNVGGGDFLMLFDAQGHYRPWKAVRTAYLSQGPNLTRVQYSGLTADGAIACEVEVLTPRTDDLTRIYHRLRYRVVEPVGFSRLAFYQVGSDRYHWHQYRRIARGNTEGLIEEWEPGRGGRTYLREGIPVEGSQPWFSLHDAIPADGLKPVQGGWATRGLVVRAWKARLGGRDVPATAAVFGTQAGNVPSANLELVPPPGCTRLERGDFVEADLELLVLPRRAEEYYGPNLALKESLATDADTWRGVWRQARGNHLQPVARRGRLVESYPPLLQLDARQRGELEVTGGVGWVPFTFRGVRDPGRWTVQVAERRADPGPGRGDSGERLAWRTVDQSVHGRDFWQAAHEPVRGTWDITLNLPMDAPGNEPTTRRLRFLPDPGR